jgi:hypothetical protein
MKKSVDNHFRMSYISSRMEKRVMQFYVPIHENFIIHYGALAMIMLDSFLR